MAIEYVPGFWGALSQGASQGIPIGVNQFNRNRDREDQLKQQELQRNMENFRAMLSAYQSGAASSNDLNAAGQAAGMQINAMPSLPQMRNSIVGAQTRGMNMPMMTPAGDVAGVQRIAPQEVAGTDDVRSLVGLPTRSQLTLDKANTAKAQTFLDATPDQRAQAVGIPSQSDMALDDAQKLAKYGGEAGDRYVGGMLANPKFKGRISPKTLGALVDQSFAEFMNSDAAAKKLAPEQIQSVKSAFGAAATDRYIKQQAQDAENAYRQSLSASRGTDPRTRIMGALQAYANMNQARLNRFESTNSLLLQMIGTGQDMTGLNMDAKVAEYNKLKGLADGSSNILLQYSTGVVPDEGAVKFIQEQQKLLMEGDGTPPPPKPIDQGKVDSNAQKARMMGLDNDKDVKQWLELYIKGGGMTKEEANAVAAKLGRKVKF